MFCLTRLPKSWQAATAQLAVPRGNISQNESVTAGDDDGLWVVVW